MKNILYCGMVDDVLTPFILEPDFDCLYVLDKFDSAFSPDRTLNGQRRDILKCLSQGNDKDTAHYIIMNLFSIKYSQTNLPHGQCLSVSSFEFYSRWSVSFIYNNKERKIITWQVPDYTKSKYWFNEIKDISHLVHIGAPTPVSI
jgi:hypothetical protein